jgi:hypothetical protein
MFASIRSGGRDDAKENTECLYIMLLFFTVDFDIIGRFPLSGKRRNRKS